MTESTGAARWSRRRVGWMAACLLVLHAVSLLVLAASTPWTSDEPQYVHAGLAIRRNHAFDSFNTILHGPVPFLANQVLLPADIGTQAAELIPYKFEVRVGAIGLTLLAALGLFVLARAAFGGRVALLALLLHILNPVVLAHGCLATADMALAAGYTFVTLLTWRWLRDPTVGRLLLAGAGLGASLATKYLALFLLPSLVLVVVWAVLRGFRPGVLWSRGGGASLLRRALDLLPAAVLAGTASLLTLHTCYLWTPGTYQIQEPKYPLDEVDPRDPAAGPMSQSFRELVKLPGAGVALGALPAPFVRGIDFQRLYADSGTTWFGDRIGPGFAGYFVTALAVKLPLPLLALLVAGLATRCRAWPRHLAALLACLSVIPLLYLSLATTLQIGVRYLLPIFPLLAIVAAHGAASIGRHRLGRLALGGLFGALVFGLAMDWPKLLGSFNLLADSRQHLLFRDSNLDWHHEWSPDLDSEELALRHPESVRLFSQSGPRFGKLRILAIDVAARDARDPTHNYHWLRRFKPVDRLGRWLLFDIDEAEFRQTVGLDPRGLVELAVALVGDGRPNDALHVLEGNPDPDAATVREIAVWFQTRPGQDPALAPGLLAIGRADLVLQQRAPVPPLLLAMAWFREGSPARAREVLESVEALDLAGAMLLATCLNLEARPEEALAIIEQHAPPAGTEAAALHGRLERQFREQLQAIRAAEQASRRR